MESLLTSVVPEAALAVLAAGEGVPAYLSASAVLVIAAAVIGPIPGTV